MNGALSSGSLHVVGVDLGVGRDQAYVTISKKQPQTLLQAARRLGALKHNMRVWRPDSTEYGVYETEFDQLLEIWSPFIRLLTRNIAWP